MYDLFAGLGVIRVWTSFDIHFERNARIDQLKSQKTLTHKGHTIEIEWIDYTEFIDEIIPIADERLANIPDQRSPSHILNRLNDDCLAAIFNCESLDGMDLSVLAGTCKRFDEPAKKVGKLKLKNAEASNGGIDWSQPFWRIIEYIRVFGELITNFYVDEGASIFAGLIDRYCRNVTDLQINLDGVVLLNGHFKNEMVSIMKRLEKLSIVQSKILQHLETLEMPEIECPQLIKVQLSKVGEGFNHGSILGFFYKNPQIRSLALNKCAFGFEFHHVLKNLLSLEEFTSTAIKMNVPHLGLLTQLKILCVPFNDKVTMKSVLEVVVDYALPVHTFRVTRVPDGDVDFLDDLCQITTLKTLYISQVSGDDLVEIIQRLPNLTELTANVLDMEFQHVLEILQIDGSQLNHLEVTLAPTFNHTNVNQIHDISRIFEQRSMVLKVIVCNVKRIPVRLRLLNFMILLNLKSIFYDGIPYLQFFSHFLFIFVVVIIGIQVYSARTQRMAQY